MYYKCKKCKKRFISEELVKSHLQWAHDIPPHATAEIITQLKKELREIEKEFQDKDILDNYFWN